jgi:hypothetical protein
VAALGVVACSAGVVQATDFKLKPRNAAGTVGTDWVMGPGANEITLKTVPQNVCLEVYYADFGAPNGTVGAYGTRMNCTGYTSGDAGEVRPVITNPPNDGTDCSGAAHNTFNCTGVDTTRADWILAGAAALPPACNVSDLCGDATPGQWACGAAASGGSNGYNGVDEYGMTFCFTADGAARGTFELNVLMDPDQTYVQDADGNNQTPFVQGADALVTIETGSCCTNLGPGTSQCVDGVLASECTSVPFVFTPGGMCAGDNDMDGDDDSCPACTANAQCNDMNACTTDTCTNFVCSNVNTTPAGQCCNPGTGALTPIDDGDQCTGDTCNPATGQVDHPILVGDPCNDGNGCTVLDACDAMGACAGQDANAQFCDALTPCLAGTCNLATNLCECSLTTDIDLEIDLGGPENCFAEGDPIQVTIVQGAGSECVNGGQFLVTYDPSCIDFTGATCGATYPNKIFQQVNEAAGEIFIACGVDYINPGPCSQGPEDVATLSFTKLDGCGECNLCFANDNPRNTILSNEDGNAVPIATNCSKNLRLNGDMTITVPGNVDTNADCDEPTANVSWAAPSASDECSEVSLSCTADHDAVNVPDSICLTGGVIPQGRLVCTCTATDDCGKSETGSWTVDVSDEQTLDLVVQLSPIIVGNPIDRCIKFELFSNCVQAPSTFMDVMTFGFPYNFVGHASDSVKIPKGQYGCITAKDPLHTLRSTADIECVGAVSEAVFKGDPTFGGNWLVGGNLDCWKPDGNGDTIDILDFGMFINQLGVNYGSGDTDCSTPGPHADINGDGMVDGGDYAFISDNYLANSKDSCCEDGVASAQRPITEISVKELRRRGFGELVGADLNGDGWLNSADIAAYLQGQAPVQGTKRTDRKETERTSLGN